tara:strand:- start:1015 stop:1416 length:402 start_codon:yes stop_codon:yes gene_type:complete
MPDDPNQAAICNAAIDRSNQDALTIARLCEEITLLRQRLKAKTQTVIDQDVLRRSIEKSLRDEIFERSREFQSAIKELNKQLEHERREHKADKRTFDRNQATINELRDDCERLREHIAKERTERIAAQRTIAR